MQCARRRWGQGTTCERPSNSPAAKEMQDRLTQMKAERASQDGMWNDPTPAQQQQQPLLQGQQQSSISKN